MTRRPAARVECGAERHRPPPAGKLWLSVSGRRIPARRTPRAKVHLPVAGGGFAAALHRTARPRRPTRLGLHSAFRLWCRASRLGLHSGFRLPVSGFKFPASAAGQRSRRASARRSNGTAPRARLPWPSFGLPLSGLRLRPSLWSPAPDPLSPDPIPQTHFSYTIRKTRFCQIGANSAPFAPHFRPDPRVFRSKRRVFPEKTGTAGLPISPNRPWRWRKCGFIAQHGPRTPFFGPGLEERIS
jgi:hypothetical protein